VASLPENGFWLLKRAGLKNYMVDKVPKKKIASVNFSHALFSLLDILILEYGADRLSQNVSKELPLCAA
jgi:hypothetical protein